MTLAMVMSRALDGMDAPPVQVEVHLANGLPSFTLVGLADTEVKEARERVRAALLQSGLAFPSNKRITVNLAPAELPKDSGRFDLPIALGILAADGQIDAAALQRFEFAGELSLAGELRPVRGALAIALALGRADLSHGARTLVLPEASAREAALASGVPVCSAKHLLDVVAALQPGDAAVPLPQALCLRASTPAAALPDLADVRGQATAKRALEIAAAGAHSLLMVGPPGAGKSMLAQRLPGLLPPMSEAEALASAAIASLAGAFDVAQWKVRPLRSPHHSATAAAIVGGGSPPRPGEISLAYGGVLFLDEIPEMPRGALEALREPLETGRITISRAARSATFPARFQLVAAMNPCPCGWLGAAMNSSGRACRCTPDQVARYQGRLSGPLIDRIDLQVEVPAVKADELMGARDGDSSAIVAARVCAARERALQRQGHANAELNSAGIDAHCALDDAARTLLQRAAERLGWTGRGLHRVLKVARTIADLAASPTLQATHIAEAMQWRRALPVS